MPPVIPSRAGARRPGPTAAFNRLVPTLLPLTLPVQYAPDGDAAAAALAAWARRYPRAAGRASGDVVAVASEGLRPAGG